MLDEFLHRHYRFQSTLPRGERPFNHHPLMLSLEFQSTLPRGERLRQVCRTVVDISISIHAPTRGATSITTTMSPDSTDFNPRSHEGSDGHLTEQSIHMIISIHAPTRGATAFVHVLSSFCNNFNPRSHEGSDKILPLIPYKQ